MKAGKEGPMKKNFPKVFAKKAIAGAVIGGAVKNIKGKKFNVEDQQARRTDRLPQTVTRKSTMTDVKPQSQGGTGKKIRYGSPMPKKRKVKLDDGSVGVTKTFKNPITGRTRTISKNKGGKHNVNMKTVVVEGGGSKTKTKMKGKMGEGQKVKKAKGETLSEVYTKMLKK